ncbi:hypothetical protein U1E44_09780 [Arenibacter sp. GZD96]|uniref:hypothetical protein n=1 Tax=Aurantibrevibacter litoralis TaxID=3106030 RepID=UPI002AFE58D0|nr:hypothetical protein [Arenibacter sp. GZD-96]MEA1786380.1 hypothetical protein [Arenibacter sp. GZD-96]
MRFKEIALLCMLSLLSSCHTSVKKDTEIVHTLRTPAGMGSFFPSLVAHPEGAWLTWMQKTNDTVVALKYAVLKGETWESEETIVQGTDWFVNWADFPSIAIQNQNLLAHTLQKSSSGTYSYDIKLHLLPKNEEMWQINMPLHEDNTPTEHGFVTMLPYRENSFFVTWLDGRHTAQGGEHEHHGAMSLRSAEVLTTGEVIGETLLDARTCDCCQTTAAITKNGPVVLYRDRSEDEIRDISIVRWVHGAWTAPQPIYNDNWQINGCPVNGPKAAARDTNLAVAWFSAADANPTVKVVFSSDGGAHFDTPITVSEKQTIGRVDVVFIDDDTVVVSYMETGEEGAYLKAVKVPRSGTIATPMLVTKMDASRSSGFPQMELVDHRLIFAWTATDKKQPEVKMAAIRIEDM